MAEYKLKRGVGALILIDDCDLFLLHTFLLATIKSGYTRYVTLREKSSRQYTGLLHRVIMGAAPSQIVDHINGNGLDNRRENLRICTQAENQQNRRVTVGRAKGVFYRKDRGYWTARITVNKQVILLGKFATEDAAVTARLAAEEQYHPFAGKGTSYEY